MKFNDNQESSFRRNSIVGYRKSISDNPTQENSCILMWIADGLERVFLYYSDNEILQKDYDRLNAEGMTA